MRPGRTMEEWIDMMAECGPPARPIAVQYIAANGEATYRERYNAGWRYSERVGDLTRPDADGRSDDDAWMDGYLDAAVGRERYHLAFCADHDSCP